MARPSLCVRPATADDLPALLALGDELRDQLLPADAARGRGAGATAAREALQSRYAEALEDRRRHVVVVVDPSRAPEEVLGMALLTVGPATALLDHEAVHLNHAVVADRHRRKGAGRALVAAAAAFAEERGLEQLIVSVHAASRDANRFFARLGFAPLAVRRSTSVTSLRRQLAASTAPGIEHLVRQRRRPRRELRVLPDLAVPPARRERRA